MNRNGLKQQQAADLIGVSQATISNWCKGKTPDYETLSKLITFGMTACELFGKELGNELMKNSMVDTQSQPPEIASMLKEGVLKAVLELKSEGKL